jgi:hypothetical protein
MEGKVDLLKIIRLGEEGEPKQKVRRADTKCHDSHGRREIIYVLYSKIHSAG